MLALALDSASVADENCLPGLNRSVAQAAVGLHECLLEVEAAVMVEVMGVSVCRWVAVSVCRYVGVMVCR